MSKSIFYVELQRVGQAPSKFKFAIDCAKKSVKDVRDELKGKLVQKKAVEDTHELILKDKMMFELASDDEVEDVLPEQEKNVFVLVKGEKEPSVAPVSVISQPSVVASVVVPAPIPPIAPVVAPPVAPVVAALKLSESLLVPQNKVQPYQDLKHSPDQYQLKFSCPQISNNSLYGIIVPKNTSHYQLSQSICQMFNFAQRSHLNAVIYHFNGQPLIWSMDFMSMILPADLDERETFTVIFTGTHTTSEKEVKPAAPSKEKHMVFLKLRETLGVKVDLETTTVGDIQSTIFQKLRIHPDNQILKFGAKILTEVAQPLHIYGLVDNSLIQVHYKVSHRITSLTFKDNFYSQSVHHQVAQSEAAKRTFRANMVVFCKRLPAKHKIKLLAYLRQTTKNNPMVCALEALFNQTNITEVHKIALEQGMLTLFQSYLLQAKDMAADFSSSQIFTLTRQCLGYYLSEVNKLKDMEEFDKREKSTQYSPICEVTLKPINDPVYIRLDSNQRVLTDRQAVLDCIKNKTAFAGVANLTEGSIMEGKDTRGIYSLFSYNTKLCDVAEMHLRQWEPQIMDIDYLREIVEKTAVACKWNDHANVLTQISADLKIFNPLELKSKCDYIYLLKDKNNVEKIYVGKHKDIHLPHLVYDVLTGSENAVNFDIMGGVAGSESVDKPVDVKEIKAVVTRDPAEAIVVLLDISGSMGGKFFNEPDLKRIGAVKSFFEALAYRTMAYNLEHVISLILFDDKVDVKVDFTESFHDFNLLVANAHPRGSTLLYDAMVTAARNLLMFKKKYPNCILRILALTDGEDTGSKSSIVDTARLLIDSQILVDSFVVGSNCEGLKCITMAAGGKCYLTREIQQSLKLFEQETVLSARARKTEAKAKSENVEQLVEKMKFRPFDLPNNVHEFKLPEIDKPSINIHKFTEELKKDPTKIDKIAPTGSLKRIVKELTNYQNNPHPFVSVYPCEDMTLWKILLLGPKETPYQGGLFQMYAKFPADYPFKPPEVRFVTPIYHCNMNSQGRICHSVFDRNYSPAVTFRTIVDAVYGLILTPEPEDPLDNVIATYFLSDYQKYFQNAVKATKSNAGKSVEQIVESLFGKIADDNERQKKIQEISEWVKKAQANN